MVEASDSLARFVGLDAYTAAGGVTRADLFGNQVYLEKPDLLHRLAKGKLDGIRKELEADGWGWVEVNPDRDGDAIFRCGRIQPRLIEVPVELVDLKNQLDAELEIIEETLAQTETDDLLNRQQAIHDRLEEVEQKLAGFVGFDPTQKALAGCFVSIGHDGTPFLDKGLVKPEHRKVLEKLLRTDGIDDHPVKPKPKNGLPESLRRDLAAERLPIAQVEIARHPATALDLLTFRVASEMIGKRRVGDGPNVEFKRPKPGKAREASAAERDLVIIEKALPTSWLKANSEADRFEAFRSLPEKAKLDLLAYCVALTLQPKLGPVEADEATGYDTALSLTGSSVAGYWRPSKGNFLSRINREKLLAVSRVKRHLFFPIVLPHPEMLPSQSPL
jgi:ParB family chromosome partitioning protein